VFKIPGRVYTPFATILGLPGTENIEGMQREGVPTQDLTRMMQAVKVKHTLYTRTQSPVADDDLVTLQWDDASDWTEVSVNGVLTTADGDLPQPTDSRWIIDVSLQVATAANFLSAEVVRRLDDAINTDVMVQTYTDVIASHALATPLLNGNMPLVLSIRENNILFRGIRSAAGPSYLWSVQLISAIPGVLSAYPGS